MDVVAFKQSVSDNVGSKYQPSTISPNDVASLFNALADLTKLNVEGEVSARIAAIMALNTVYAAISHTHNVSDIVGLNVNAANGIAGLDGNAKLLVSQFPDELLGNVRFRGLYDGSTVTSTFSQYNGNPLPAATSSNAGTYFIATASFTNSGNDYNVGDWIISVGSQGWKKVDNTDAVTSVCGKIGNVLLNTSDVTENANSLYFTNARALAATLTSYNPSAGTIGVGTTLARGLEITAYNVSQVAASINSATDQPTASTLMKRDGSGSFSASGASLGTGSNGFNITSWTGSNGGAIYPLGVAPTNANYIFRATSDANAVNIKASGVSGSISLQVASANIMNITSGGVNMTGVFQVSGNITAVSTTSDGTGFYATTGISPAFSFTRQSAGAVSDLSISAYGGIGLTGGRTASQASASYAMYLSAAGNVSVSGTVTAPTFIGNLTGIASGNYKSGDNVNFGSGNFLGAVKITNPAGTSGNTLVLVTAGETAANAGISFNDNAGNFIAAINANNVNNSNVNFIGGKATSFTFNIANVYTTGNLTASGSGSFGSVVASNNITASNFYTFSGRFQATIGGAGNDPYGAIAVSAPYDANTYSYFGLTRSGQIGWSMGINTANAFAWGTGGISTFSPVMTLSPAGNLTVSGFGGFGAGISASGPVLSNSPESNSVSIGSDNSVYCFLGSGGYWGIRSGLNGSYNASSRAHSFNLDMYFNGGASRFTALEITQNGIWKFNGGGLGAYTYDFGNGSMGIGSINVGSMICQGDFETYGQTIYMRRLSDNQRVKLQINTSNQLVVSNA